MSPSPIPESTDTSSAERIAPAEPCSASPSTEAHRFRRPVPSRARHDSWGRARPGVAAFVGHSVFQQAASYGSCSDGLRATASTSSRTSGSSGSRTTAPGWAADEHQQGGVAPKATVYGASGGASRRFPSSRISEPRMGLTNGEEQWMAKSRRQGTGDVRQAGGRVLEALSKLTGNGRGAAKGKAARGRGWARSGEGRPRAEGT